MYKLMIKKCMNTGLMYLCQSKNKDPYSYKGSGTRWCNHIRKHKSYIITCVLGEYENKEDLKEAGLYYSKLYDVVNNQNWANLTEENGSGGKIGNGQLGKRWKVKNTSNMGKHKNQWKNDDGTRKKRQSERMKKFNPSKLYARSEKQSEASRKSAAKGSEASKKKVIAIYSDGTQEIFQSKREVVNKFGISYDILNNRIRSEKKYNDTLFRNIL